MVGQAFQTVIRFFETFGKKKIAGWNGFATVPRKKAGPQPALLND